MKMNRNLIKMIVNQESLRMLQESEAHEEDLIHNAYHGGGARTSTPPGDTFPPDGSETDDLDEPENSDDEPFIDDEIENETTSPDEEVEKVKKSLMRRFNDSKIVDFGLDILGTVGGYVAAGAGAGSMGLGAAPAYVLAAVPDLLNSIRHAVRGESFDAAIYFLCALPIIGEVLGPVRISMKLLGTAARASEVYAVIDRIRKLVKGLKASRTTKNVVSKIKDSCEKYFPDFDSDSVERDALIVLNGSDDEVDELLRRSGYISDRDERRSDSDETRRDGDDDVSTEASPLAEGRRERSVSIIFESSKSSKSSKSSSKKLEPLPPIPTTIEFEREMRDVIAAYHAGEDIESWLTHDILGSKASPHGLSRKTGWSGDDDFYRKPSASYIAQHLATHRDPELRAIGQRVLRKMGERMGSKRFARMGSGFGLDPIDDED